MPLISRVYTAHQGHGSYQWKCLNLENFPVPLAGICIYCHFFFFYFILPLKFPLQKVTEDIRAWRRESDTFPVWVPLTEAAETGCFVLFYTHNDSGVRYVISNWFGSASINRGGAQSERANTGEVICCVFTAPLGTGKLVLLFPYSRCVYRKIVPRRCATCCTVQFGLGPRINKQNKPTTFL